MLEKPCFDKAAIRLFNQILQNGDANKLALEFKVLKLHDALISNSDNDNNLAINNKGETAVTYAQSYTPLCKSVVQRNQKIDQKPGSFREPLNNLKRKYDIFSEQTSTVKRSKKDKQTDSLQTIFLYPSCFQAGIDIELIDQLNQVIGLGVKLKIIASDIPSFENIYFVIKKYCEEKYITCPKMEYQSSSSSRDIIHDNKNSLQNALLEYINIATPTSEREHSYSKPHL